MSLLLTLYQPEIPQNVGSLIRLSACFNIPLHIIEPLGFVWHMKYLKRSSLDYIQQAHITRHSSWGDFYTQFSNHRRVLLTPGGTENLYTFIFKQDDILLFGRESDGVPETVAGLCPHHVKIPIRCRSLNLALSASIVVGEASRQLWYP